MRREIVLDTETTGLDPRKGDRLIEIGCVELINRMPTGEEFHVFINPERAVPAEAEAIHGISTAFLQDKPLFQKVAKDFMKFIGEDVLVIHNANFDISFINMELERLKIQPIGMTRVVDTLQLARRKFPAGPNNLDALCKRFGIDNSKRIKHGALMDSLLLAEVYLELLGERQAVLGLASSEARSQSDQNTRTTKTAAQRPTPLSSRINAAAREAHVKFVETLGPKAIWQRYFPPTEPPSGT